MVDVTMKSKINKEKLLVLLKNGVESRKTLADEFGCTQSAITHSVSRNFPAYRLSAYSRSIHFQKVGMCRYYDNVRDDYTISIYSNDLPFRWFVIALLNNEGYKMNRVRVMQTRFELYIYHTSPYDYLLIEKILGGNLKKWRKVKS